MRSMPPDPLDAPTVVNKTCNARTSQDPLRCAPAFCNVHKSNDQNMSRYLWGRWMSAQSGNFRLEALDEELGAPLFLGIELEHRRVHERDLAVRRGHDEVRHSHLPVTHELSIARSAYASNWLGHEQMQALQLLQPAAHARPGA